MAQLLELGDGRFRLEGELNLHTVANLARESRRLFPRRRDQATPEPALLELDLAGVTQARSAAVALMLDWLARANSRGSQLRIINWPESMVRIAKFSNLAELLEFPKSPGETGPAGA
ncbi:STAS domain-containing protein [Thiorhodovibrio frisius]|uniref:Putative NTP binding protein (Contains STAS domain) n=1 Tax=Thiorhodovibrio frisius TaxID=631362 RepID=H8YZU6_9GAMM|nr:STAS domain-containing protein [Thiorhodovibrio frisius]EIC22223.1 putative NTP binding protein (contains STAS domain) [Thiorhodovibrio frisius]WPL24517.1 anti-anti-sigma factor [Thiorhodovibrio frisius]